MKAAGSKKLTGAEQRALAAQLAQASADPAVQAQAKESSFLRAAQSAQDDLIWLITNEAWSALGFGTFADWWDERVSPVLNELPMLRPTREVAQLVIERVRAEDEHRPKSLRRTSKQLAAMVGLSAATARRIPSRSSSRSSDAEDDLEKAPPVIDSTFTEDTPLSRLSEALAANGPTVDVQTETGHANLTAILEAVQAALAEGGTEEAYAAAFGAVEERVRQAGLTAEQIEQAIGKYRPGTDTSPASVPVVDGLRAAIEDTAASVGAGVAYAEPRRPIVLCPIPRDLDNCQICGDLLKERNAGYLRCLGCDPRQEHIAEATLDGLWAECRLCHPTSAASSVAAAHETAAGVANPPADAGSSVPAAGSGDGASLVAGSGLPNTAAAGLTTHQAADGAQTFREVSDDPNASEAAPAPTGDGLPSSPVGVTPEPDGTGLGSGQADQRAEHQQENGWAGEPGQCGVSCVCGAMWDGFETLAEPLELLRLHIANPEEPEERIEEEALPVDSEELPAAMGCPLCPYTVEVSTVDSDASVGEMNYHLGRTHDLSGQAAHEAWVGVRTIPPGGGETSPSPSGADPSAADAISTSDSPAADSHNTQPHAGVPAAGDQDAASPPAAPEDGDLDPVPSSSSGESFPVEVEGPRPETDEEIDEWLHRVSEEMVSDLGAVLDTEAGLAAVKGHHLHGGVGGEAPDASQERASVEPEGELEDGGGTSLASPSSSDPADLMVAFATFVQRLDLYDVDVLAPLLLDGEMTALHAHADRVTEFVGLLEAWRTP